MSLATAPTRVSMPWWMSRKRAWIVSVRWALRPSMVSVTLAMRWSTAAMACAVPSVSVEVSRPRRESIDWIACAAPSVSDDASVSRQPSMVSVTDLARVSKHLDRLQAAVERFIEPLDRLSACRQANRGGFRASCRAK